MQKIINKPFFLHLVGLTRRFKNFKIETRPYWF